MMTGARKWVALVATVVVLMGVGLVAWSFYALGGKAQEVATAKAQTKATVRAANKTTAKVRADLARATTTGQAREADRARLDELFNSLDQEANHAPSSVADDYVLPDDRLRIWRDANAGRSTSSDAPGRADQGAADAAAASIGGHPSAGGQPPAGGAGLPPAGVANVPAAGVSAAVNGGL